MAPSQNISHVLIAGAGAAGLMAASRLARAGKQVTVLEARDRCGGRILTLPEEEFGYPAEGGPEFIHGAAPVTLEVIREAGLTLLPRGGSRWSKRTGKLSPDDVPVPHMGRFYEALEQVGDDLPIAKFLEMHFADPRYEPMRRSVTRTVEGYDAADPWRFSTLALREEWMARDGGNHGRLAQGYGALIDYLADDCRAHDGALHLGAEVVAVDDNGAGVAVRCRDGAVFAADAVVLAVPHPILPEIALPPAARERAALAEDIGMGNVVKTLLRFATRWWADYHSPELGNRNLADLSFLISEAAVPTWWTQHPATHPVLTGWYAGPKADRVAGLSETELVDMGLNSLAEIFALPVERLRRGLVAARSVNWGIDPFARGAYSYATTKTRAAQAALREPVGAIFFSGEALNTGPDIGTVEAALTMGRNTASAILAAGA
jgi:monoamine oxidase